MKKTLSRFLLPRTSLIYRDLLKMALGVVFYVAISQITIPFHPIPMTLQTLGMLMIGLTYTKREAFVTTTTWLTLGILGAPVFAGYASGLGVVLGPRGGFVIGLTLAPIAMAWIRERVHISHPLAFLSVACAGQGVLLLCGLGWLSTLIGWEQALISGLYPFVLWEALKTPCAALCAWAIKHHNPRT